MFEGKRVKVIIPAMNEEKSVGKVVREIPGWVDETIVVDNGSTDNTAAVARSAGAVVVKEPRRGYGQACLSGIRGAQDADIIVFLDADYSDRAEEMSDLVGPIVRDEAEMVIGSRVLGNVEAGSLTPQQRFGNWLATRLVHTFFAVRYTDLGPFRAIKRETLQYLAMQDTDFGWTVEMQVKAALAGVRVREVPVSYRKRIGKSKISGTVKGVLAAGFKILLTIFIYAVKHWRGEKIFARERVNRRRLVIFSRYPEPGKTKTRLIAKFGETAAAWIQKGLTERQLREVNAFKRRSPEVEIEIRCSGGSYSLWRKWLGDEWNFVEQGEGGLGERLTRCARDFYRNGYGELVVIGIDCPSLDADLLSRAFSELETSSLVFGPAVDGGYYLVGMSREIPEIFEGVEWGTESVLSQTLEVCRRKGLDAKLLEERHDIDLPEDIHRWKRSEPVKLSIIIPTLNEEAEIGRTLWNLSFDPSVEIIVVDGGSVDGTAEVVSNFPVRFVRSEQVGRGFQMAEGVRISSGATIIFLHADTGLPSNGYEIINGLMASPGVKWGAFGFAVREKFLGRGLLCKLVNFRSRWLGLPYGDQALFMRRDFLEQIGGVPEQKLMEDVEIVRRTRRTGALPVIADAKVLTSGRRWIKRGLLRATLENIFYLVLYLVGKPAASLWERYLAKGRR